MDEYIKVICEECKEEICLVERNATGPIEVGCFHCWIKDAQEKKQELIA